MSTHPALPSELLDANGAFLRQLASSLLHDPGDADDLSQDAWLASWRQKVAGRPLDPDRAPAWYRAVLRRRHATLLRARDARRDREAGAARSERVESAVDAAARIETAELLLGLVRQLDGPVRTAVVGRYYEGLTYEALGQRESTPPSTIRSRVERGLQELRLELDRRDPEGRTGWMSGVAAIAVPTEAYVSTVKFSGLAIACAAVAVAAVCLGWAWQLLGSTAAPSGPGAVSMQEAPASRASSAKAPVQFAALSARAGAQRLELTEAASPEPDVTSGHRIEGRVLDVSGRPVAGAGIWVSAQPTYAIGSAYDLIARATSSEGGGFKLTLPPEWIEGRRVYGNVSVMAWKQGHGPFHAVWAPDEVPAGVSFDPVLGEVESGEFFILNGKGEPYRGARVLPTALWYGGSDRQVDVATEGWDGVDAVVADEAGRVDLPLKRDAIRGLKVEVPTGGVFELQWADNGGGPFPQTLTLVEPMARRLEGERPVAHSVELETQALIELPSRGARKLIATFRHRTVSEAGTPWSADIPGEYLHLIVDRFGPDAAHYFAKRPADADGPWHLEASTSPVPKSLMKYPAASGWIYGTATTKSGDAVPGAWVTAAQSGEAREYRVMTAVTDQAGRFRMGPVPASQTYELVGRLGGLAGRAVGRAVDRGIGSDGSSLTDASEEIAAEDRVRVVLSPALQAHARFEWPETGSAPRLWAALVSSDVLNVSISGELVAGGRTHQPVGPEGAVRFDRALEADASYAIRYDGLTEGDRRRVIGGTTNFYTASELSAGVTVRPELHLSVTGEVAEASTPDVVAQRLAELKRLDGRELAKDILWPRVKAELEANGPDVMSWLEPLLFADPDASLAFLDSGTWQDADGVDLGYLRLMVQLAPTRPEEALELARRKGLQQYQSYVAYLTAPALPQADALKVLKLGLASVSHVSSPEWRFFNQARIAQRLFEIGQEVLGRTVLDEAVLAVVELPDSDSKARALGRVGTVLCAVDLTSALELIDASESRGDRGRMKGAAASWIARLDTNSAAAVLESLKNQGHGGFHLAWALPEVAYRVAQRDAKRSLELVDRFGGSGLSRGLVALALADRGALTMARETLQAAFAALKEPQEVSIVDWEHPVASGAFLLAVADVVDPESVPMWQDLVLGLPREPAGSNSSDLRRVADAELVLAAVLSARRPDLAQGLLEPWLAAIKEESLRGSAARSAHRTLAAALALISPTALEARLNELPENLRDPMLRVGASALARMDAPRGTLLAALKLQPRAWWPGVDPR